MATGGENEFAIKIKTWYDGIGINKAVHDVNRLQGIAKATGKSTRQLARSFDKMGLKTAGKGILSPALTGDLEEYNSQITKATRLTEKFNFAWLSIMFGGMAIKRIFMSIWKSATGAFTNVMKTVEGATTNVGILGAQFEYLKFTIGNAINTALEPLMPMLIKMLDWAAEFVEKHPEGVFQSIAGALAGGTFLAALGSFMLFVGGVKMLLRDLPAVLTSLKLLSLVGLGLVATVSTWKILSEDGTSFGERAFNVGSMTVFGAVLGSYIAGPLGAAIGGAVGLVTSLVLNIVDYRIEEADREAVNGARQWIQELFDTSAEGGFTLSTEQFSNAMETAIRSTDVKKLESAWDQLNFDFGIGVINEEQFRNQAARLMMVVERDAQDFGPFRADNMLPDTEIEKMSLKFQTLLQQGEKFETLMTTSLPDGTELMIDQTMIPAWARLGQEFDLEKIKVDGIREAIDLIPDHSVKIVEIRTIHTTG